MKSGIGAVFAAVAASACCLGPVVFTAIGSGALAAASTKLAVVRPMFLGLTAVLLGFGFYRTYRAAATASARPEVIARDASFFGSSRSLWCCSPLFRTTPNISFEEELRCGTGFCLR